MEEMTNRLAHVKPELKRILVIGVSELTLLIIVCVLISQGAPPGTTCREVFSSATLSANM